MDNEIQAFAKINLALDVIRKRPDGYHDIKSVMHTVKLHDSVYLRRKKAGISVECDNACVPQGADNIAYKAALVMTEYSGIKDGIEVYIKKRIPISAGLGGGSADAAAVLKGMNDMFSLGLTVEQLAEIGRRVGSDVPFCVVGGTALVEGTGEILTALEGMPELNVIIITPNLHISTAWAYSSLGLTEVREHPGVDALVEAVKQCDMNGIAANMGNVFESVIMDKYPAVKVARDKLLELGAMRSVLSGSGPSVFGIYRDSGALQEAYENIRKLGVQCYAQFDGMV